MELQILDGRDVGGTGNFATLLALFTVVQTVPAALSNFTAPKMSIVLKFLSYRLFFFWTEMARVDRKSNLVSVLYKTDLKSG